MRGGGVGPPISPSEAGGAIVSFRQATDAEVKAWQDDGWELLESLIGTNEIDALAEDLRVIVPSTEELHADPRTSTNAGSRRKEAEGMESGLPRSVRRGRRVARFGRRRLHSQAGAHLVHGVIWLG